MIKNLRTAGRANLKMFGLGEFLDTIPVKS